MRRELAYLLSLMLVAPVGAYALGLGNIERKSTLNEPFDASIKILGARAEELDSLKVRLADVERFQRAGLERPEVLSQLRFEVIQSERGPYIKVTSQQPIREPFLNLLLEVSWSKGRIFREYTVLLDPPLYDPRAKLARQVPVPSGVPSPQPAAMPRDTVEKEEGVYTEPRREGQTGAPDVYGPTEKGDTLSEIATQLRPNRSASLDQVMLALLRANPEAFFRDNVNALKTGFVLRLPDVTAVKSISKAKALAQVQQHHALWQQYRMAIVGSPTPRPIGAGPVPQAGAAVQDSALGLKQDDAHLKLVSPSGEGAGLTPAAPGAPANEESSKLRNELALVREELEAKRQESAELNVKLAEADDLIKLLQRKLEIKDDELATLQAKVGTGQPPASAGVSPPLAGSQPESQPAEAIATIDGPAKPEQAQAPETPPATPAKPVSSPVEETKGSLLEAVSGGTITLVVILIGLVLALVAVSIVRVQRRQKAPLKAPLKEQPLSAFAGEQQRLKPVVDPGQGEPVFEAFEEQSPAPAIKSAAPSQPLEMTAVAERKEEAVAPPPEEESDPLAEVNVYLAYERFDQAAEVVKQAIQEHPDKHEYKLRLLEVYYAGNDKSAYEDQARILYEAVEGKGPLWESALAMWREMSPERALFEREAEEAPVQAQGASKQFIDITGASETLAIPIMGAALGGMAKVESGLDFDLSAAHEPQGEGEIKHEDLFDLSSDDSEARGDRDMFEISMADISSNLELALPNVPEASDISPSGQEERLLTLTNPHSLSSSGDDFVDFSISYEDEDDIFDLTGGGDEWAKPASNPSHDPDLALDWDVSGQKHAHEPGVEDSGEIRADADIEGAGPEVLELELEKKPFDTVELIKAASAGEKPATEEDPSFNAGLDQIGMKDLLGMMRSLSTEENKSLEEFQRLFEDPVKSDNLVNEERGAANDSDTGSGLSEDKKIPVIEQGSSKPDLEVGGEGKAADSEEEMDVKLNLAKAYLELGDVDGARSVLDEVVQDGTEWQKREARQLLGEL